MTEKMVKSETEWRKELTPEEYRVTREAGTEPAFSGKYWKTKDPGTYHCVCCGAPLFEATTKFDSGTGWPSFYAPADEKNVVEHKDSSYGMVRTEVLCKRCGGHPLACRRGQDAEHDAVRIDLRVGPGKINLVFALHQRHDPLLLDQRRVRVVELDFHPLAHRQRNQFHAGERRG